MKRVINGEKILPMNQRPKCRNCKKPLRPMVTGITAFQGQPSTRAFSGNYGDYGDNEFCGLHCGYSWGRAIAQSFTSGDFKIVKVQP